MSNAERFKMDREVKIGVVEVVCTRRIPASRTRDLYAKIVDKAIRMPVEDAIKLVEREDK